MSSSRRNTQPKTRSRACSVCSEGLMVDVVEIVVFQVRGRNYRFEKVRHELCNNCGERIFDLETNRMFDEKILLRRESRVA